MDRADLKKDVKSFVASRDVDLVGFVSTEHLDQVIPTQFTPGKLWPAARTAISIGKRLLDGAIDVGLGDSIQNARWVAWRTNEMLNRRAMELAHFLERRGVRALPLSNGTMADPNWTTQGIFGELSHRHIAAEAGLGVIGVPTYCITPQFGPRVYFNTILTDVELEPDKKIECWDPCGSDCNECIDACPAKAIERGLRTIRKKKCIPYAMPHGVRTAQTLLDGILAADGPEERARAILDFDFTRVHRATVTGVGTIAGCFFCLAACPVGKGEAQS